MNSVAYLFALVVVTLARNNHSRRQVSQGYLPRCRFDEHILKNHELFAEKIKGAHVVFTGKVASEVVVANGTMKFRVMVRRYFKNVLGLPKNKEVRVLKISNEGEGAKCRQPVRMKYTAIFVGRKAQNIQGVDVVLIMSPISVTLTNLDRVSEATKEMTYIRGREVVLEWEDYLVIIFTALVLTLWTMPLLRYFFSN
ncbi:unnamed protein product [Acanthoscelides obtectus]|uniref:Uncharacterized protein n=1 Tax=Acanthoscelides obtectus TaxID=200917 RepID=A0A9P0NVF7_ACAOB|nr:unnamed protein product [Acanthoscelides obtectus]CAK1628996.1 hypothetical protein AOBTE_LOCUS5518 [Acanthoscelides obtectus]